MVVGCNQARVSPDLGEFEDAVILKTLGDVPDDFHCTYITTRLCRDRSVAKSRLRSELGVRLWMATGAYVAPSCR
jgi:hypothetical protein